MISLEQIRLLEQKVTSAVELIRVLKEENATLRRGLDSAQRRMKELETLVEGFKTDQKEIESVIVRTLRNLDDLEESAAGTAPAAREKSAARPEPPARQVETPGPKSTVPVGAEAKPHAGSELDIF
jgi:FtsZ-binding cell division protein ZapB